MQPMNYMLDVQKPFDGALQGINTAIGLSNAIDQDALRKQELLTKQAQLAQAQQQQQDLRTYSQIANPTTQQDLQIASQYPALAEHFKNIWGVREKAKQQTQLTAMNQVLSALDAGKPDIAKNLLDQQVQAAKNSGDAETAQHAGVISQLIDMNPTVARDAVYRTTAMIAPDKYASNLGTIAELPGKVAQGVATAQKTAAEAANKPTELRLNNRKTAAEINNLNSEATNRADKLMTETQLKLKELQMKTNPALNLGADATKIINDSAAASVEASQSAQQMTNLADQLDATGGGYGAFSSVSEWLKKTSGNQDAMSELRSNYTRLKNSQAVKMLPPGSASDKDVQLAMSGFPSENADAKVMASFMRGLAKLNQTASVVESAKSEWVNGVGHLGKAKSDINIDGVNVPQGTTFVDFTKQYVKSKVAQQSAQSDQAKIQSRSYMRHATAGAQ